MKNRGYQLAAVSVIAVFLLSQADAQFPLSFEIPLKSGPVALQRGSIDPAGSRYVIVQFDRVLSEEERAELRGRGINLLSFLYNKAWLCAAEQSAFTGAVINNYALAAVIPWRPEYKIATRLKEGHFEEWAVTATGEIKLLVTFFQDVAKTDMGSISIKYSSASEIFSEPNIWAMQVSPNMINSLINETKVQSVVEGPPPRLPILDTSRALMNVNQVQLIDTTITPPSYNGLSGKDINIAVCELVDQRHPDFFSEYDGNDNPIPTSSRFLNYFGEGGDFHGTHVAGIIAGNGWNSNRKGNIGSPYQWRGMAPEVSLIQQRKPIDVDATCSFSYESVYRVDASNHSYVTEDKGIYGVTAETIDSQIRGGRGFQWRKPHIWGVGNQGQIPQRGPETGYYSIYTPGKNALAVGAVNTNDSSLAEFSSLGPTFDGRIKPDVVAGGSIVDEGIIGGIVSTASCQGPGCKPEGYEARAGTSQATPAVTGTVALMLQQFVETHGTNLEVNPPLPSTIKAILIQTTRDLVHDEVDSRDPNNPDTGAPVLYYKGPDFATGYGLVDAQAAVDLIADPRRTLIRESKLFSSTQPQEVYELNVPGSIPELKITLVWDDVEASSNIGDQRASRLVNNLDLVLKAPSGQWYYPWRLDPLPVANCDGAGPGCGDLDPIKPMDIRPAYRGPDGRNNVEQVQIDQPQMGKWQAFVYGSGIEVDGQSYSLVANLPLTRLSPSPSDKPKHGDFNGDGLVDHSDNLIIYKHISNVPDYLLRDESFNMDNNPEVNIADILVTEPASYLFFIVNQFLRVSTFDFRTIQDSIGCPMNQNFVARYNFTARFINSLRSLHAIVIRVLQLSNGNLLKNADSGPGGEGTLMTVPKKDKYADGILGPWFGSDEEFVDVPFEICLKGPDCAFFFLYRCSGSFKRIADFSC